MMIYAARTTSNAAGHYWDTYSN